MNFQVIFEVSFRFKKEISCSDRKEPQTFKKINSLFFLTFKILGSKVSFGNLAPDIYTARIAIVTDSWINTEDGTLVIDGYIIQFPDL